MPIPPFSSAPVDITGKSPIIYDAIVDVAGGGDFTTIEAAITDGAISIFVRSGTYTPASDLTFVDNMEITGEERGGVTVDMGASNQITMYGVSNTKLQNMTVKGTDADGTIESYEISSVGKNHIINNIIFNTNALGMFIGAAKTVITGCAFINSTDTDVQLATEDIIFSSCEFDQTKPAILVEDSSGSPRFAIAGEITISGCHFRNSSPAIKINGAFATVLISNCNAQPPSNGNAILATNGFVIINNNVLAGTIESTTPVVDIQSGADMVILSNNEIDRGAGIKVDADNVIISGNFIRRSGTDGISLQSGSDNNVVQGNIIITAADTGIDILSGATSNIITGNIVRTNTVAQITDNGTTTQIGLNVTS